MRKFRDYTFQLISRFVSDLITHFCINISNLFFRSPGFLEVLITGFSNWRNESLHLLKWKVGVRNKFSHYGRIFSVFAFADKHVEELDEQKTKVCKTYILYLIKESLIEVCSLSTDPKVGLFKTFWWVIKRVSLMLFNEKSSFVGEIIVKDELLIWGCSLWKLE